MAEIVGLWLAEGDHTTSREITFTNNDAKLIEFFHRVLSRHFQLLYSPRVYVYLPSRDAEFPRPVPGARYRTYLDPRANFPYFIYRASGVELVKRWKEAVLAICNESSNYVGILQGFFAGEGNIKETMSHHSRALRIAQGKRFPLLERILRSFGVEFRYEASERSYVISGRENLEKLWNLGVSALHSKKQERFSSMLASYTQRHYERLSLGPKILKMLSSPLTKKQLADRVGRSDSRVNQALTKLRRAGKVEMFKVRSLYYWIGSDRQAVIISREKSRILRALDSTRRQFEIARMVHRSEKSVSRRLSEMARLGLVERANSNWRRIDVAKRVIVK